MTKKELKALIKEVIGEMDFKIQNIDNMKNKLMSLGFRIEEDNARNISFYDGAYLAILNKKTKSWSLDYWPQDGRFINHLLKNGTFVELIKYIEGI